MLAIVLNMLRTHNLPIQNLNHTDIYLVQVDDGFQNQTALGFSLKHKCFPPPLKHLKIECLMMKISFLAEEGKVLNVVPSHNI